MVHLCCHLTGPVDCSGEYGVRGVLSVVCYCDVAFALLQWDLGL